MSKKLPTLWSLQPHTNAKHQILRGYLKSWMPIMTQGYNRSNRAVLIDGFAGPGEYDKGEKGSPLIMIEDALNYIEKFGHTKPSLRFIFVEKDKSRFEHLMQKITEKFDNRIKFEKGVLIPIDFDYIRVYLINEQYDEFMTKFLNEMNGNLAPSFAFIDPFGFKDIPFELIEKLAVNRGSEVFINFMYEDINRFLKLPKLQKHYHRLFGTDKWADILNYLDNYSAADRRFFLHKLYKDQLREAGYKYVISFEMKNEKNSTEYFLYFGSNHIRGLEKMKDAMWDVDNSGAYTFSDYEANLAQLRFVEFDQPDLSILADEIYLKFQGQKVATTRVKEFVITDTIFRKSVHSTAALKMLEEQGLIKVIGRKSKRGFSDSTTIYFM
jgi:three-Cys-motif partner protein